MHISSHISVYHINQTHFLLPTLRALNSLFTQVASDEPKPILFHLVKTKFPNSDMSILWGKNAPWNISACLRQSEIRNTCFTLCTGPWYIDWATHKGEEKEAGLVKTSWKQV